MTSEEAIFLLGGLVSLCEFYEPYDVSKPYDTAVAMAIEALKAQDDSLNEWCTDCKEYDAEKHCCPRFNRVIRTALQDADLHSACTEVAQDTVSRQAAIDAQDAYMAGHTLDGYEDGLTMIDILRNLPSAQPDYQEILGWLLAYHTKSFDLHGRYFPHEAISWLINDFTREFILVRGQDE